MKGSAKWVAVGFLAWLAWKGYQTMNAIEGSSMLRRGQ